MLFKYSLVVVVFLQTFDATAFNIILPDIAGEFGVSFAQATLITVVFIVATAISLPLTNYLAQRFTVKRVFVFTSIGFGVTSMYCALAPDFEGLLIGRFLQGLVAAPPVVLSHSLFVKLSPAKDQPRAVAIWTSIVSLAPLLGPVLGAILATTLGWRSLFLINVLPSLLAAIAQWNWFPEDVEPTSRKSPPPLIWVLTLIAFSIALAMLVHSIAYFDRFGYLGLLFSSLFFAAFIIFLSAFDRHEFSIGLSLFGNIGFLAHNLFVNFGHGALLGLLIILPIFMNVSLGIPLIYIGIALAPSGILSLIVALNMSRIYRIIDISTAPILGSLIFIISFSLLLIPNHWNFIFVIMISRLILGFGQPLFYSSHTSLALSYLKDSTAINASSAILFVRYIVSAVVSVAAVHLYEQGIESERLFLVSDWNNLLATPELEFYLQSLSSVPVLRAFLLVCSGVFALIAIVELIWRMTKVYIGKARDFKS